MRARKPEGSEANSVAAGPVKDVINAMVMGARAVDAEAWPVVAHVVGTPMRTDKAAEMTHQRRMLQPPKKALDRAELRA